MVQSGTHMPRPSWVTRARPAQVAVLHHCRERCGHTTAEHVDKDDVGAVGPTLDKLTPSALRRGMGCAHGADPITLA